MKSVCGVLDLFEITMRCRIFVTLIFLFMFTIVQSLDFPYFLEPSGKNKLDGFKLDFSIDF